MSLRIPLGKLQVLTFLESPDCHVPSCPAVWENSEHVFPTRVPSKVFFTGNWTHSGPSRLPLTFIFLFLLHLGSREKQLLLFPPVSHHLLPSTPSFPSLWALLSLGTAIPQPLKPAQPRPEVPHQCLQITSPTHPPPPTHTNTFVI